MENSLSHEVMRLAARNCSVSLRHWRLRLVEKARLVYITEFVNCNSYNYKLSFIHWPSFFNQS